MFSFLKKFGSNQLFRHRLECLFWIVSKIMIIFYLQFSKWHLRENIISFLATFFVFVFSCFCYVLLSEKKMTKNIHFNIYLVWTVISKAIVIFSISMFTRWIEIWAKYITPFFETFFAFVFFFLVMFLYLKKSFANTCSNIIRYHLPFSFYSFWIVSPVICFWLSRYLKEWLLMFWGLFLQ